ncbi:MAG: alpha-1,2-fucosyltransferase [Candidatus Omnitrophica bacterium]|nr:alpha-1,2-fucosyltransferase [Patescibacteria group bacterium]MBU1811351.1 alpha-1,2-fucosyltransferase [Candidatus Omnitrophota bacterium]
MSKVIVRIKGGLGNQLFCYAAARRLALVNNSELIIDGVTGFVRDHQYHRKYALDCFNIKARKATSYERMEPFERYRRALAKFIARQRPFDLRSYLEQEGLDFDARLLDYRFKRGTVYLDGLWQSENYFKDIEEIIRQDLRITPPKDEVSRRMAERILSCNAVAVHVRFFDKPNNNNAFYNLRENYYLRATREILSRVEKPHFFLFSDNLDVARRTVKLPEDQVTCVDQNRGEGQACADLWLMTQCKHFIIANSTFSWWGAWLGAERKKIVIAPNYKTYGKTAWGFKGLIPDRWVKI